MLIWRSCARSDGAHERQNKKSKTRFARAREARTRTRRHSLCAEGSRARPVGRRRRQRPGRLRGSLPLLAAMLSWENAFTNLVVSAKSGTHLRPRFPAEKAPCWRMWLNTTKHCAGFLAAACAQGCPGNSSDPNLPSRESAGLSGEKTPSSNLSSPRKQGPISPATGARRKKGVFRAAHRRSDGQPVLEMFSQSSKISFLPSVERRPLFGHVYREHDRERCGCALARSRGARRMMRNDDGLRANSRRALRGGMAAALAFGRMLTNANRFAKF
jgi:hypothetical protein